MWSVNIRFPRGRLATPYMIDPSMPLLLRGRLGTRPKVFNVRPTQVKSLMTLVTGLERGSISLVIENKLNRVKSISGFVTVIRNVFPGALDLPLSVVKLLNKNSATEPILTFRRSVVKSRFNLRVNIEVNSTSVVFSFSI